MSYPGKKGLSAERFFRGFAKEKHFLQSLTYPPLRKTELCTTYTIKKKFHLQGSVLSEPTVFLQDVLKIPLKTEEHFKLFPTFFQVFPQLSSFCPTFSNIFQLFAVNKPIII